MKMFKAWLWMIPLSTLIIGLTIWLMVTWAKLIWLKVLIGLVGMIAATVADLAALWLTWGRYRPMTTEKDDLADEKTTQKKPLR
ncbi:hypothetical protein FD13_GL000273 [Levilactobacillus senmaizukei DSM 21775 = NBRC 103853]|uniref:Uncharacterized protein n=1 Tax=Levilactobacillus senmaizukei DSM 21775 = NBRC 103853 TaxID=1423803 RepID=A0A0R2DK95_9LACO|nr:hypothetical protein [Levilactobacillus senmaizukei]KRN02133.1 hypothetical protein FD13_GL000273 [Levilactobacillus senmaizukei DSM 21775 = NBRC 103853]